MWPRSATPFRKRSRKRVETDGKTYLVQYFEWRRLKYHPENSDPQFNVLLGLLGSESYTHAFGKLPECRIRAAIREGGAGGLSPAGEWGVPLSNPFSLITFLNMH